MKVNFQSKNKNSAETTHQAQSSLEALLKRTDLGFFKLPQHPTMWNTAQEVTTTFAKKFKKFVWVGIGGSSLGPKSMALAFANEDIYFVENPDLKTLQSLNKKMTNWQEVGFVFVSKSGTTIETLSILDYYLSKFEQLKLNLANHSLVITELKPSSLYDWAKTNQVPVLEIPLDVGGRFSVLSSVGQVLVGIAHKDIQAFRKGAASVFEQSYVQNTLLPMIHFYIEGLNHKDVLSYFWYYSDSAYQLGKWLEQLWAESLAKKELRKGASHIPYVASVPVVALGANDQHSVLQQMMETQLQKSVVVHRFTESEEMAELFPKSHFKETSPLQNKKFGMLLKTEAQTMTESQKEVNNHVMELQLETLNEFTMGQYFMTYKLIVGALGEYMNIEAFNQPGVELGKIITKKMLAN
ncbi:MAG: glucose-6-phosphate isomerase [Deltaproteobacteria bacterium]|nr:glucose-6-phosphate isomerase [Deltaproteobacteria bacterium]